jgi:hypothetical protein
MVAVAAGDRADDGAVVLITVIVVIRRRGADAIALIPLIVIRPSRRG